MQEVSNDETVTLTHRRHSSFESSSFRWGEGSGKVEEGEDAIGWMVWRGGENEWKGVWMEGEGWARGEGLTVASMPPRALVHAWPKVPR